MEQTEVVVDDNSAAVAAAEAENAAEEAELEAETTAAMMAALAAAIGDDDSGEDETETASKEPPSEASDDSEEGEEAEGEDEPPSPFEKPGDDAPSDADAEFIRKFELLTEQQRRVQAERAAVKEDAAKLRAEGRKELEDALKDDPWAVLEEHGWGPEELVEKATSSRTPQAIELKRMRDEIRQLNEKLEAKAAAEEEAKVEAEVNSKVAEYKKSIPSQIAKQGAAYKFLNALYDGNTQADLVYDVIATTYQQSGGKTRLSIAQAASALEAELTKLHSATSQADDSDGVTETKPKTTPPKSKSSGVKTKKRSKTLTNDLTITTPSDKELDELTDEELDEMAVRTLQLAFVEQD